jgi:hypothetical protein
LCQGSIFLPELYLLYMKSIQTTLLSFAFMVFSGLAAAQTSNAIIFTENGERFTVILNGLRQNPNPETNVKIEGLNAEFYKVKIIFEDAALGERNFNLSIQQGTETTYVIKRNNKNEYVFRPMSMVEIAQAPPTPSGSVVVPYNSNPVPAPATVTQQTTTTTTTTGGPGTGNVTMGVNISETGGAINMNVSGFEEESGSVTTTHQTTVVTTTSTPPPPVLPGYNGPIGCPVPMLPGDFDSMKGSIESKSFEDSKLTIAKQIMNSNCLLSSQVKEVMLLFSFEDTRLDFAKYAYGKTYDIGNYYKVNDAFTFETSIDDLNDYISSYHR